MVKSIHTFRLSEAIINVFLHIKTLHVNELWWSLFAEKLLFERVTVLSVVDHYFTVGAT